jgi:hypothetical protein
MRLYRHRLSGAAAAALERQLDVLEGLAEGTGIDAGLPQNRRIPYALKDIALVESQPSYARSFAYATGPAYTELLDAVQPRWRRGVTAGSDVALMTARAYGLRTRASNAASAQAAIDRYGGKTIEAQESALATRKAALDARYTRELVVEPTLSLPLVRFHIRFNPRDVETLDRFGTVYHTVSVGAPWGSIDVSGGDALVTTDFKTLRVAAPNARAGSIVRGAGWTLRLAPRYAIVADPQRKGSYIVTGP